MNRTELCRWVSLVTSIATCVCCLQLTNAEVPQGYDFTVPADAPYKEGQLLVRFTPKTDGGQRTLTEKAQIITSLGGGSVKHEYANTKGLSLITLPPGLAVKDALKMYNAREDILYAEPDYLIPLASTFPNDPCGPNPAGGEQWGLHNMGQTWGTPDADIDAPEAWDTITDSNIIVAVIDSGVDYTHPDLAANIWINQDESPGDKNSDGYPGIQGIDDDGDGLIDEDSQNRQPGEPGYTNDLVDDDDENGYVDDIRGWDFDDNNNNPTDCQSHGTHCAGIIGATGNAVWPEKELMFVTYESSPMIVWVCEKIQEFV